MDTIERRTEERLRDLSVILQAPQKQRAILDELYNSYRKDIVDFQISEFLREDKYFPEKKKEESKTQEKFRVSI